MDYVLSFAQRKELHFSVRPFLMAVLCGKYLFSALTLCYFFLLLSEISFDLTESFESSLLIKPVNFLVLLVQL